MIGGSADSELKSLLIQKPRRNSTLGYWTDVAGILSWQRHRVRHICLVWEADRKGRRRTEAALS